MLLTTPGFLLINEMLGLGQPCIDFETSVSVTSRLYRHALMKNHIGMTFVSLKLNHLHMPKLLNLFALLILATFVHGQTTENRKLNSFDKVYISGALDAVLEKGNDESVRIESANIETAKIITEIKGQSLYVYIDPKNENYRNVRVTVTIKCKNLVMIHRSGSGNLKGGGSFKGDSFDLDMSGSGNMNLEGSIQGKEVRINKSGSGNIKLGNVEGENLVVTVSGSGNTDIAKGATKKQTIRLSGSGNINMPNVESEAATASISGSGDIDIRVGKSLEGTISGSGNITYHGNAQVTKSSFSGSGRIRQKS